MDEQRVEKEKQDTFPKNGMIIEEPLLGEVDSLYHSLNNHNGAIAAYTVQIRQLEAAINATIQARKVDIEKMQGLLATIIKAKGFNVPQESTVGYDYVTKKVTMRTK